MGLLMLPLRVAGKCLYCVLSSQRIGEDVFSIGSSPTVLCHLSNALCWSTFCTEHYFLVDTACCGNMDNVNSVGNECKFLSLHFNECQKTMKYGSILIYLSFPTAFFYITFTFQQNHPFLTKCFQYDRLANTNILYIFWGKNLHKGCG